MILFILSPHALTPALSKWGSFYHLRISANGGTVLCADPEPIEQDKTTSQEIAECESRHLCAAQTSAPTK
jgi:hypothetical protein